MAWSTPQTWTNTTLTTTALNREVRDNLLYLYATAWTAWSPSYTSITVGNGTVVAVYQQINKTVRWRFKFTLGSTSAIGAGPRLTLPVAPHGDYGNNAYMAGVSAHDTGANVYVGSV